MTRADATAVMSDWATPKLAAGLRDEIPDFGSVKCHVLVHTVHQRVTHVVWEARLTNSGAAEEDAKELVEMSEKATER
jgi:hypothetical protein